MPARSAAARGAPSESAEPRNVTGSTPVLRAKRSIAPLRLRKGVIVQNWSPQFLRVKVAGAVVAAVSIGGFAVAAAAVVKEPAPHVVSASDATTSPSTDTTPSDPIVTEPTTTPTDPPATVPEPDPAPTDPPAPPATTLGCTNHGENVSKVAHDTEPGPGHGAAVSRAAHDHEGECTEADEADEANEDANDDQPPVAPTAPAGAVPSGDHGGGHGDGGGKGDD